MSQETRWICVSERGGNADGGGIRAGASQNAIGMMVQDAGTATARLVTAAREAQGSFASHPPMLTLGRWLQLGQPFNSLRSAATHLFLPTAPVSPEYAAFQWADSLQGTCSYLRGILALTATLEGAGYEGTGAIAAVLAFVLRDGAAMMGSLCFSYFAAQSFDGEIRFWRLFADIINDVGLTVELLAPFTGQYFLLVTCSANVCKALCGVAAGSTRAGIAKHFALSGNVAEVQAKESAQETAVSLLGLLLGLLLAHVLNSDARIKWTAFIFLTLLHVACNYYAVRILRLRSLNRTRLAILLNHCIGGGEGVNTNAWLPTPAHCTQLEPVVPIQYSQLAAVCGSRRRVSPSQPSHFPLAAFTWLTPAAFEPGAVTLGCSWDVLLAQPNKAAVIVGGQITSQGKALVSAVPNLDVTQSFFVLSQPERGQVNVGFSRNCDATTKLLAYYLAYTCAAASHTVDDQSKEVICGVASLSHLRKACEAFPAVISGLEGSGWDCSDVALGEHGVVLSVQVSTVSTTEVTHPDSSVSPHRMAVKAQQATHGARRRRPSATSATRAVSGGSQSYVTATT